MTDQSLVTEPAIPDASAGLNSPLGQLTRDVRRGMQDLRSLIAGSMVYGLLPSLGVFLGAREYPFVLPLAESAAIISGSAGAVLGYTLPRPSENDRELVLALRGMTFVRAWLAFALVVAVVAHLYLWTSVTSGGTLAQLVAVSVASFATMLFFGLVVGFFNFLHEQRLVWTVAGRDRMRQAVTLYNEKQRSLRKSAEQLEELSFYTTMFTQSAEALILDPTDARARAMRDTAADWFAQQQADGARASPSATEAALNGAQLPNSRGS